MLSLLTFIMIFLSSSSTILAMSGLSSLYLSGGVRAVKLCVSLVGFSSSSVGFPSC